MRFPLIPWFSLSATFAVLFIMAAVPVPAHAEKDCCCKQDIAQGCTEIQSDSSCPSDFPRYEPGVVKDGVACATLGNLQQEARGGPISWVRWAIGEELIPANCTAGKQEAANPCTIWDMLWVVANITKLILAVLGSAAFAMFTYGGLVWLTAAGNQERVSRGRQIITNAALGILVVLVSYTAINLIVSALTAGRGGLGNIGQVFNQQWNKGP